jgi:hypothetical protein
MIVDIAHALLVLLQTSAGKLWVNAVRHMTRLPLDADDLEELQHHHGSSTGGTATNQVRLLLMCLLIIICAERCCC